MPADRTLDPGRRRLLLAAPALMLSGCKVFDGLPRDGGLRDVMEGANGLTDLALGGLAEGDLAREHARADIRQPMRPNGVSNPQDPDYLVHAASGWADWRLAVTGLVEKPLFLSLSEIMAMPSRTQITRHDCVEGWSCIAEWTGVPLSRVLTEARPKPDARFVVFRSMDTIEQGLSGSVRYWESLGLRDALHPQTILAYGMNGGPLPIANGAPLRLRVERQLGYKMAKYLSGIEVVPMLEDAGGYWEERGYDWYAGL